MALWRPSQTTVSAAAVPELDQQELDGLRHDLAGMTRADAQEMLAPIGPPTIDLWPGWVDRLPGLDWRITIDVQPAEGGQ